MTRTTPGQTVGPFFGYALPYEGGPEVVPARSPGSVFLHGTVRDGDGVPVPDAVLEVWQNGPDATAPRAPGSLRRDGATFTGFGRCPSDGAGGYGFWTLPPARRDGPAFFALTVFARGLMHRLLTRAYLPDPGGAPLPAGDALLSSLPPERARTLVCTPGPDAPGGVAVLRFDVRLQGEGETVFLDLTGTAEGSA